MRMFFAHLKQRPWLVSGTALIVLTFFLEKILIRYEQEKIDGHNALTAELLHTQSYISEKFLSRYLILSHQQEIADSSRRERLLRQTLAEYGNTLINFNYMIQRRGTSEEEFKELTIEAGTLTGQLFELTRNASLAQIEHFTDSLGHAFSMGNLEENQINPYLKAFNAWAGHQKRLELYTYLSIGLYAIGTVLLAIHAYVYRKKEDQQTEERFDQLRKFLQPAITEIKQKMSGGKRS